MPTPYESARVKVRTSQTTLTTEQARSILRELESFLERVRLHLIRIPQNGSLEPTVRAVEAEAERLSKQITQNVETGRQISFDRTLGMWVQATEEFARQHGHKVVEYLPTIAMLGIFGRLVHTRGWATILPQYLKNGAQEVISIIRLGTRQGMDSDELARRLRRYVVGSEPFDKLFTNVPTKDGPVAKIDLRNVPPSLRGEAKQMIFNSERIAISEHHNARAEAEIQHFIADPFVAMVRWDLSPNRGTSWTPPDECDLLAKANLYGLGPGVFPVRKVPTPPHPFDRCESTPITVGNPLKKKVNPDLQEHPLRVVFGVFDKLTTNSSKKARESAWRAIQNGIAATGG